jgi:hypothetical protein
MAWLQTGVSQHQRHCTSSQPALIRGPGRLLRRRSRHRGSSILQEPNAVTVQRCHCAGRSVHNCCFFLKSPKTLALSRDLHVCTDGSSRLTVQLRYRREHADHDARLAAQTTAISNSAFCLQDIIQDMQDTQSSTQRRCYVVFESIQHPCLSFADMRPCAARPLHKPPRLQT